jgi:erythromycin esterase-like protein
MLEEPRLERAVGVLYMPQSERASHYFKAKLPYQFDEICWIDETNALTPTTFVTETEEPDTFPFGI